MYLVYVGDTVFSANPVIGRFFLSVPTLPGMRVRTGPVKNLTGP